MPQLNWNFNWVSVMPYFEIFIVYTSHDQLTVLLLMILSDYVVPVPKHRVSNVTTIIHGNGISFPLDNSNACLNSGLSCPLTDNQKYKYVQTLPIKIYYPPVRLSHIYHIILFWMVLRPIMWFILKFMKFIWHFS